MSQLKYKKVCAEYEELKLCIRVYRNGHPEGSDKHARFSVHAFDDHTVRTMVSCIHSMNSGDEYARRPEFIKWSILQLVDGLIEFNSFHRQFQGYTGDQELLKAEQGPTEPYDPDRMSMDGGFLGEDEDDEGDENNGTT